MKTLLTTSIVSRHKLLAAGLALTLPLSALAPNAFAEDKSILNPVNWFSGHSTISTQKRLLNQAQKNALEAEKEAERAQQEADRTAQLAMHAREQAEKARKVVDAMASSVGEKQQEESFESKNEKSNKKNKISEAAKEDSSELHLSAAPDSNQGDKQSSGTQAGDEISTLPEDNANAPHALDGASQSDAMTRTTAPDAFKDRLPGTSSNDALRQAEEDRMNAKAAQEKAAHSKNEPKSASPWNPMSWFGNGGSGGNSHQEEKTKSQFGKQKSDADNDAVNQLASASAASEAADSANQSESGQEPRKEESAEKTALAPKSLNVAVLDTERGSVAFELNEKMAPITVANFKKLVSEGFYSRSNMRFHRVIPGFVVQTGDPTGTGAGGSRDTIPLESKNKLSHNAKGVVAMARGADPNSATSQFYITLAPQTSLDGKYAIFGKVISGMDVLDKIQKGDMLYGITLENSSAVTPDAPTAKKGFFSSMF